MSNLRRLIESIDRITEAGPKGIPQRPWELPSLEGGIGGGGAIGGPTTSGSISAGRLPPLRMPPAGKSGIGQGVGSAKPKIERLPGETPAQAIARAQAQAAKPLPAGVTPSTAGAGRGTVNPPEIKPLPKTGVLRQNPERAEKQAQQAQQNLMKDVPGPKPTEPPKITDPNAVKKSVAGHAALAGLGLLGSQVDKQKGAEQGGGTPSSSEVEIWSADQLPAAQRQTTKSDADTDKDADIATSTKGNVSGTQTSTISPTKIDLPTVGPQGPNSPFTVVSPAEPKPTSTAAPAATTPSKPAASSAVSPGTASILGRLQGIGGSGSTGTGTGSGTSTGPAAGSSSSTTGTGTGTGGQGTGTSGDPFPMMRHRLGRTDEHRSVNKLVKEFKRFVNRKV